MAFEKLKTCPLIETVCEFRLADTVSWDDTVAAKLHDHLKADFPLAQALSGKNVEITFGPKGPAVNESAPSRKQFFSADKLALIQADTRMVSANRLAPYRGWETDFLPIIRRALEAMRDVRPGFALARIGLRYINSITLRPDDLDLDHYLTILPRLTGRLERPLQGFFARYELSHAEIGAALLLQAGLRREGAQTKVVLDLDCMTLKASELKTDKEIEAWLDGAHACVIESFNASITADLLGRLKKGL